MTYQTSAQAFQSSAVALDDTLGEPRSFRDVLAQVEQAPPADLAQARAVLAKLARIADSQVVIPMQAPDRHEAVPSDTGGLPAWKARRVRAHIEASLGRVIRNGELAQIADLSVSYFCRAFRKTFGETAHLYILRRRVALAQRLMVQSRQALAEIALACGFADQAHLTRVFGRLVGVGPSRWRREHAPLLQ